MLLALCDIRLSDFIHQHSGAKKIPLGDVTAYHHVTLDKNPNITPTALEQHGGVRATLAAAMDQALPPTVPTIFTPRIKAHQSAR